MSPFLQQIADLFYSTYGAHVQRMAFVFPNRRAGLFFRKYLSHAAGRPLFSPAILTINGLFEQLSGMQPADHLQMLFLLYHIYIRRSASGESFDDFVHWGEMLLGDFDDVDKYLIDARQLFTNATHLHEFDKDLSYLKPEQVEAIRAFWSVFRPDTEADDRNRRSFLGVWDILHDIYRDLRETLAAEGRGYEGMIARDVVERIRRDEACELPYSRVVFVGLNALTRAEEALMEELQKQGTADFYWDCGTMSAAEGGVNRVMDKDNKASYFIRDYIRRFPSMLTLPPEEPNEPEITLMGLPSRIGQAKQVHELLQQMADGRLQMDDEEALRTAVVLPDEQLLIPVLNAIPHTVPHINITLGYPLTGTPVATLMADILALQKNIRTPLGRPAECYHREVTAILNHRYIRRAAADAAAAILRDITARNRIYIPTTDLARTPLLTLIFRPITSVEALSIYLIDILKGLNGLFPDRDEAPDAPPVGMDALEREFTYTYYTTLTRMNGLIAESGIAMSIDTYTRLLTRLLETVSIPFRGEPLSGLQIMGVLETRVLDFDRLIILSMNEGLFPARGAAPSFIPYNLRRGFGLPTFEHRDSVWAYHFYRMIARARRVILLYDTRTDGFRTTGEVSRFVHQLRYHYEVKLHEQTPTFAIASSRAPVLRIEKTGEVLSSLEKFLQAGSKHALSPSTINNYIDCPLRFCLSTVMELQEEEEVTESVEHRLFGSILHRVMEDIYHPMHDATVTKAWLGSVIANRDAIKQKIAQAFAELFFHDKEDMRPLTGQNLLTAEMIEKYVLQILRYDQRMAPSFIYVDSELQITSAFPLSDGRRVNLKGYIDRIDEVGNALRVVDYKTGKKMDMNCKAPAALFDSANTKRQSAIMQVFTYAWMLHAEGRTRSLPLRPSIYYVRNLFAPDFDPSIYAAKPRGKKDDGLLIDDFVGQQLPAFESALRATLDALFDPRQPFVQTDRTDLCDYCAFRALCGRNKRE